MKIINIIFFLIATNFLHLHADDQIKFSEWKKQFKKLALSNGISEDTLDKTILNVKFLPKVIEYDRYQPEFYEVTKTYINKELPKKVDKGMIFT